MKRIKVVSLKRANEILGNPHSRKDYDRVLSVGDPGSKPPMGLEKVPFSLRLEFDDLDENSGAVLIKARGYHGEPIVYPSVEHAQKIIDNSKELLSGDGVLLIHCYAGVSRSTAAAYILASLDRGPGCEMEALDFADKACAGQFDPNPLLVQCADNLLRDYDLKASLDLWIRQNQRMFG